jgi:hypothetical protein
VTARGETFTTRSTLFVETCCSCGTIFALEQGLQTWHRQHPKTNFYCPNGHSQYYTSKSDAEIERERAERAEREVANLRDNLQMETISHRSTKAALTKERKRIENGVCPCCHRTFVNVARHMNTKHPDFAGGLSQ